LANADPLSPIFSFAADRRCGQARGAHRVVGDAVDAVIGHRLAEASVQRFVADVGAYLRNALGKA
jgi:hypothetical protein